MASESDSDEDFVTFGTPLEPLEEDEPLKKPIPIHEQTVKDEKGRFKRFHGAFTGGFSAGYFNTVGSKEGWTPSTFVSSRQQKADKMRARPEDFMDEEDFGEHGIAPKEITTTEEFVSKKPDQIRDKAKVISSLSAAIPGDSLLEELITPAKSSIGVELLRKMGWKDGQGVGPRVKRKVSQRRTDSTRQMYGCDGPPAGSENSDDEEEEEEFAPENVTFAPKDIMPIDFTPKVNLHGLGYRGLDPQQALMGGSGTGHINLFTLGSDRTASLFGDSQPGPRRRGVTGQAFGVGALEDDDDDIYQKDSMARYDMVLGGEEPGDGLYGWTAPMQYKKKKDYSKDASYIGKILEGFTLASKLNEEKTIFPPPNLPRDFRPVHHFRPVVDLSTMSPIVAQALQASKGHLVQEEEQQAGRHQLDSSQRRELLGETAIQGPNSVFDLLKSEDRERLSNLRNTSNPPGGTASGATPPADSHAAMVSAGVAAAAAKASAQRALASRFQSPGEGLQQQALTVWSSPTVQGAQTFKPFEKTPSKQARYDQYITLLKQGDKDALERSLDPTMTEWERGRERDEFSRAALLYKPSTSLLSHRFTRGKQEDNDDSVEVNRDEENDVDDKQAAVKMKMFGKLTRDTFEWHPDKLLCKRFNVPDPYPGSSILGMPKVKRDKFSVFNFLTVSDSPTASSSMAPPAPQSAGKRSRWDQAGKEEVKKDPLTEFLSVARNEASRSHPSQTPSPTMTPTAAIPATDPNIQTKLPAQENPSEKKTEVEDEEEEEENRPPMDLFKAIFAESSDDKSSSSSEAGSEEEEEKDEEGGQSQSTAGSQLAGLFNITAKPTPTSSAPMQAAQRQNTIVEPSKGLGSASTVAPQKDNELEEEMFGPKLPPPSSALTSGCRPLMNTSPKEERHKKKCKEKHKAKKQHKHKKDKKKKHKKQKHKGKQKKSKKETSDSSSEESGLDSDDGEVSTAELLKRIKSVQAKQLR